MNQSLIGAVVAFFCGILLFNPVTSHAQVKSNSSVSSKSIQSILNDDGSIKMDRPGSFNTEGFSMVYGKNGEPRFIKADEPTGLANPADAQWDPRFGVVGANGFVYAFVNDGNGNLYVGGNFNVVGNTLANRIAKWNGETWSAVGQGFNNIVRGLALKDGDLYAVGNFTQADGVTANRVAKWDGTSWTPVGTGMDSTVFSIAVLGSDIVVGGAFTTAGGNPASRLAKWDGSTWSQFGGGANDQVNTLVLNGNDLYVGGRFTLLDGTVVANRVAKWAGSSWSVLGSGANNEVLSIACDGNDVYVGGTFTTVGGTVSASRIAKWNGSTWSALGAGSLLTVNSIGISPSGDIYAGGVFNTSAGSSTLAKWDAATSTWNKVGSFAGESAGVFAISFLDSKLYIGGIFPFVGANVASFDGSEWRALTNQEHGVSERTHSAAVFRNELYVGSQIRSQFGDANADTIFTIVAKWNGTKWTSLPKINLTGGGGGVYSFAVDGNDFLYVGGSFVEAVRRWDGTSWTTIGTGFTGSGNLISALEFVNGELYAGGTFTAYKGDTNIARIAKWNGSTSSPSWSAVGSGSPSGSVSALKAIGSDLYVGGAFTTVGGITVNNIAKWDGTDWSALGTGASGSVLAMAVSGTELYVGGVFTSIGGVSANRVAKWNGSTWSAVGPTTGATAGPTGNVVTLAFVDGVLYAGGSFTALGTTPANRIGRFDGTGWSPLGSGIRGAILDGVGPGVGVIAGYQGDVYVGGIFQQAGAFTSVNFARWIPLNFTGPGTDWHTGSNWFGGSVPVTGASVAINGGDPIITNSVSLRNLQIADGVKVTVANGGVLEITGTLTLYGDLDVQGTGRVSILNCDSNAVNRPAGTNGYILSQLERCVTGPKPYLFPVGTVNGYSPVTLSGYAASTFFTVKANQGRYTSSATNLPANRANRWWNITETGIGDIFEPMGGGNLNLLFGYQDGDLLATESSFNLYRTLGGTATLFPGTIDTGFNKYSIGGLSDISGDWTLASLLLPSAGGVSIRGRVLDFTGRPVRNATVLAIDPNGETLAVKTNNFGFYYIGSLKAGTTYVLMADAKAITYAPKLITPAEDLSSMDFTP